MPLVNPYNFVPLKDQPDQTSWDSLFMRHRLSEENFSGRLDIIMTAVTPVFVPSLLREDIEIQAFEYQTKNGPRRANKKTFKRFNRNGNIPFIQSTSVKGMIRSVFEAISNSCMALFAEKYQDRRTSNLYPCPEYKVQACNREKGLCPACAVFGLVQGEETHLQGKVAFSDAISDPDFIERGQWILKELSSPKPERHVPFYAKDGKSSSSGPKGRKFYYHHGAAVQKDCHINQKDHNQRNVKILERLKAGSRLTSSVEFSDLTQRELSLLLHALELDLTMKTSGGQQKIALSMGHKIGMGKPLGLGSVYIMVSGGFITKGAQRYRSFDRADDANVREQINEAKKAHPVKFSSDMIDLFALARNEGERICYPDYNWFHDRRNSQAPLPKNGIFSP